MPPKDKYTDPKLRDEVKEEIHKGDKGGAPGQWSARKAQMMASEYKKRGGDYTTDKKDQDSSQSHLSKWGEEDWQTKEGSGNAKQEDGTQKRYLPKKAWENMSEEEKKATDDKKQEESAEGKQHVGNTDKAKESRKKANEEEDEQFEKNKKGDNDEDKDGDGEKKEDDEDAHAGQKRTRNSSQSASKKQKQNSGATEDKSNGKSDSNSKSNSKSNAKDKDDKQKKASSKQDDASAPAQKGSTSRLPEKGQKVQWKSLPGWVEGEVVEIAYEEKEVEGKKVKATKEDPRVVLKSSSSGKIAVHKPDAVYFD